MTRRFSPWALLATLALALGGCASFPVASDARDREAKTFAVRPGAANLYVYREDDEGSLVVLDVLLDEVPMGRSAPRTYFAFEVAPGRRTITSRGENTSSLTIEAEEGRSYFVRQAVRPGWLYARTRLDRVDEATGRAGVLASRLVPGTQDVEVRIDSADPALSGPLACEASNAFGSRPFTAPGVVAVFTSTSALRITCRLPAGGAATTTVRAPGAGSSPGEKASASAATGASVGAAVGVAAGVAAAPVMGPAFAILVAAGSVVKGGQIGGTAGAIAAGDELRYPSPILLRIVGE